MMLAQHSSKSAEWYSPNYVLDCAREVLGRIDFDPASSEEANRHVKAASYLSKDTDALDMSRWPCENQTVYLNPPGGRRGNKSQAIMFWHKLLEHRQLFSHAIFLGFSLEIMQTSQGTDYPSILDFPFCVPRKRIRFDKPGGERGPSPTHANVIAYVPGRIDKTSLFEHVFTTLGRVHA